MPTHHSTSASSFGVDAAAPRLPPLPPTVSVRAPYCLRPAAYSSASPKYSAAGTSSAHAAATIAIGRVHAELAWPHVVSTVRSACHASVAMLPDPESQGAAI